MIVLGNLKEVLLELEFVEEKNVFSKYFSSFDGYLKVDFSKQRLIYPEDKGLIVNERQTCNFKENENFVVFECVHRLLLRGYKPEHIELEPKWKVGHGASGGRADILVKDNTKKALLIIECKTEGNEFKNAWKETLTKPTQLFSYAQQVRSTKFLCLYTSDYIDNKVKCHNYVITLKDNENLLNELKDKGLLVYKDAKDVNDIYKVWKETYKQDYATRGIFEEDIQAYNIGKQKFAINDLDEISSNDIQGKYHEFATILRQHNVSGRENAFDKLVNLFLCKIVDETRNTNNLKFYWKGIAYDNYFDLQDRLQQLYKAGMKEFLGEDVTYIDNKTIDNAFRFVINDPDATRDTIKRYFRELKFFTNNDFAFIDVHNEKLFYQNAEVLLKVVLMLQDIRLKTDNQNQFLGDMFEGFLDQGVKQSEGQYFTPMPIVKFILMSLPLEKLITESEQIPKVIDYACGAGHFLNEYATQIKPYVKKSKKTEIDNYYPEIIGIDKEYRLSKVAKVSAFMYGQDDIKIIYADALGEIPKIKEGDFSVLIANPPYSVKGFLETLKESERNKYDLIKTIDEKSMAISNCIEAFFIERAKQLLKPGGIAGIIVPSALLTKGSQKITSKKQNVYVATREILLKYFDIVAIAKFESDTFGKTPTNTVTLFLKRKVENPAPADHYKNRVEAWFNGDTSKDGIFADEYLIKKYCNHIDICFEDYKTLLYGLPNNNLLHINMFKGYHKDFESSTEVRALKKTKTFKHKSLDEQKKELDKRFINYVCRIEKEKLYYFVLASKNSQEVVIVKCPSDNNAKKKFLGYEWSDAKGNEGIKYIGSENASIDGKTENDENNERLLNNILNLDNIQTPLYDPKNQYNPEKINTYISANFREEKIHIPESISKFVTTTKLVDMLDFTRIQFNKTISLAPKKNITIDTKWDLVKLENIVEARGGNTFKTMYQGNKNPNDIPFFKVSDMNTPTNYNVMKVSNNYVSKEILTEEIKANIFDDETLIFPKAGKAIDTNKKRILGIKGAIDNNIMGINVKDESVLIPKYLYEFFVAFIDLKQIASDANPPSISAANLYQQKIPIPTIDVQKQIVNECNILDIEYENALNDIEKAKKEIETKLISEYTSEIIRKKVSEIAQINPSKTEIRNIDENTIVSFVEMASVSEDGYISTKENKMLKNLKKGSYKYFKENDIIIAKITPCMENGKCALATGLSNGIGMGSSEFHVIRVNENVVLTKYVFAMLNREVVRKEAEKNMSGSSGHRRVPAVFYENYSIPVPDNKSYQQKLIDEIERLEAKVIEAKNKIQNIPYKKEEILKKYL